MAGFNGSGTFVRTYNWVTDKGNSVKVTASRMDGEDDGFATGLSTCITKDGQTTTTVAVPFAVGVKLSDGSVGTPALNFINDTDSGLYRIGANNVGIAVAGTKVLDIATATISSAIALSIGGTLAVVGQADFTATASAAVISGGSHIGASATFTATCQAAFIRATGEAGAATCSAGAYLGASATFTATCAAAFIRSSGEVGAATCSAGAYLGASASFTATCQAATLVATSLIQNTGGQIAFPATQVPSAGANVLDDYEEGTWTPAVTFSASSTATGLTYGLQLGTYTKIGRLVMFEGVVGVSDSGSSAGNLQIKGLPFVIGGTVGPIFNLWPDGDCHIDQTNEDSFGYAGVGVIGQSYASLQYNTGGDSDNLGEWFLDNASAGGNAYITISGHYIV